MSSAGTVFKFFLGYKIWKKEDQYLPVSRSLYNAGVLPTPRSKAMPDNAHKVPFQPLQAENNNLNMGNGKV